MEHYKCLQRFLITVDNITRNAVMYASHYGQGNRMCLLNKLLFAAWALLEFSKISWRTLPRPPSIMLCTLLSPTNTICARWDCRLCKLSPSRAPLWLLECLSPSQGGSPVVEMVEKPVPTGCSMQHTFIRLQVQQPLRRGWTSMRAYKRYVASLDLVWSGPLMRVTVVWVLESKSLLIALRLRNNSWLRGTTRNVSWRSIVVMNETRRDRGKFDFGRFIIIFSAMAS